MGADLVKVLVPAGPQRCRGQPQGIGKTEPDGPLTGVPSIRCDQKSQRGGNGLADGKHLGCGRPGFAFASGSWSGGPSRRSTLAVGRPVRPSPSRGVGFAPRRMGGPGSSAPYGRSSSRWVARPCFFRAGTGTGERQEVFEFQSGWGTIHGGVNGRLRGRAKVSRGTESPLS